VSVSTFKKVLYWGGIGLGIIYLLNPGAGVFELIPDNIPIIGNLDEAAAFGLILACYRKLRAPRALPVPADKQ
jgi:hypothetical protein